jgi:hypothetical protein
MMKGIRKSWMCIFYLHHLAIKKSCFARTGQDVSEGSNALAEPPFGSREVGGKGLGYPSICIIRESAP